jgi:hypothetical protein
MRPACFRSSRQYWRRLLGSIVIGGLAFSGLGCHQYFYCYPDPACAPVQAVPSTVRAEPMCDVSSSSVDGGTTVARASNGRTTVSGAATITPPRVVVSTPSNQSRLSWRSADPEGSAATTSVQGANDSSVKQ